MIAFLDTSAPLRVVLRDGPSLAEWGHWSAAYASVILSVEIRRTLDRLRLTGSLDSENFALAAAQLVTIEGSLNLVGLTDQILHAAAQPMPVPVRTLDAIHLATALAVREMVGEPISFVTHDRRQAAADRALGLSVVGVET